MIGEDPKGVLRGPPMNETNFKRLQKSAIAPINVIRFNGCFLPVEPSSIHMLQFKDITCTSN